MFRQALSLVLALLIGVAALPQSFAQSSNSFQMKEEDVKKRVVEWGTNKNVSIKLKSKEKLKGRISDVKEGYFTVQFVEKSNKQITTRDVNYADVTEISAKGNGSAGKIIGYSAIGAAAGLVAAVFIIYAITGGD
ncbi:MAG TPA: hypothetical protein VEF04_23225 [Blastocatellia bacterium]|nr:hypothetical protein [Blastocatellia bacterium]